MGVSGLRLSRPATLHELILPSVNLAAISAGPLANGAIGEALSSQEPPHRAVKNPRHDRINRLRRFAFKSHDHFPSLAKALRLLKRRLCFLTASSAPLFLSRRPPSTIIAGNPRPLFQNSS